ncbi:hypothetical protein [Woeseia oceani]|nr:hypothetical protein [Woeseia oceani]
MVTIAALLSMGTSVAEPTDLAAVSTAPVQYEPGQVYETADGWIEYHAGNLPIIVSAPHGGRLTPSSIPDRTADACGGEIVTSVDTNTAELALALKEKFHEHSGKYPHVIINRLKRTKLDANRDKTLASCGNAGAENAWESFLRLIEAAKAQAVANAWGKGFYIDVHGMRGSETQLGFLLSRADLQESNSALNENPEYRNKSSVQTFAADSPIDFAQLLRGDNAIGTKLVHDGFPTVPSKQKGSPTPDKTYFAGGYNTGRHGCRSGGKVCGLQVETPYKGVRDNDKNRMAFAESLVQAVDVFLDHNFGFDIRSPKEGDRSGY